MKPVKVLQIVFAGLFSLLFAVHGDPCRAAAGEGDVTVATRVVPPLVIEQDGHLSGFSIDLWNALAERLKIQSKFEVAPDLTSLLDMVRTGKARAAIAAISITSDREAEFDFSYPILNSGLQIMVGGRGRDAERNPLVDLLNLLFSPAILVWLGIAALLVIIPAHVVWFSERFHHAGFLPSRNYFPGIFHALFWAASTLATQGEQMPRQWLARIVAVLWMFIGVVFVAFYTAQLTANLTVQQIQGRINGPDDLVGKRVATVAGSTAAAVLRELNADRRELPKIEAAYEALANGEVDAVVYDAPVLMYYAANQGRGKAHLVGSIFRTEDYGIIFQDNNSLRKKVDKALLSMREDGSYQQIHDKWFKPQ